ncbi:MAG: hypothetical protein F6K19_36100 [Cyanothece sp. SIO1E1]|nr:hypothetical protein [Cyanothece sp. SIO1E1]
MNSTEQIFRSIRKIRQLIQKRGTSDERQPYNRAYITLQYDRYQQNPGNQDPLYRIASHANVLPFDRLNEISLEGSPLTIGEVAQIISWLSQQGF